MVNESGQQSEPTPQAEAPAVAPPARDEPPEVEQLPGPEVQPQIIEPTKVDEPSEDEPEEKAETQADASNVVAFPVKKPKRGRKPKPPGELRIDYVKASRNTFAFRVRWKEADGTEPAVYVSRVNDRLFNSITKGKTTYAAFKKQLVAGYLSRTIRQGDRTDASAHRSI